MKCSYKRCRLQGDHISVASLRDGTFHLCIKHWIAVSKTDGSIQQQLTKVAIPTKPPKQGD